MRKHHVLIGVTALTLAFASSAVAGDWVCPPIIEPDPPVQSAGDPDRYLYCVLETDGTATSVDLLLDQPYLEPLDPRWIGRDVVPANVGLPGNEFAVWC